MQCVDAAAVDVGPVLMRSPEKFVIAGVYQSGSWRASHMHPCTPVLVVESPFNKGVLKKV